MRKKRLSPSQQKKLKTRKNEPLPPHIVDCLSPFEPPNFTGWDEYPDSDCDSDIDLDEVLNELS